MRQSVRYCRFRVCVTRPCAGTGRPREAMRIHAVSKVEWMIVAVVAAVLGALLFPTPNWRETFSESCHSCGNCRTTVREYRWWQLASESTEPRRVPLLARPAVPQCGNGIHTRLDGSDPIEHCWTSQQWHPARGSEEVPPQFASGQTRKATGKFRGAFHGRSL
jgi:hypothetical protein